MVRPEDNGQNWYEYTHTLNKNVSHLIDKTGSIVAHYDHDAYGNMIEQTGVLANRNPIRFSSEYDDEELGLIYYNYRHYNPRDGRWINRDPITESGGNNLYSFKNNYLMAHESLGLLSSSPLDPRFGLVPQTKDDPANPNDGPRYSQDVKDFLKKNCKCFKSHGTRLGMDKNQIISTAMAISDELSTRTGAKAIVDHLQDTLASSGKAIPRFQDIGKGNINDTTAKNLNLDNVKNADAVLSSLLNDVLKNDNSRRQFIASDEGTVLVGLIEMQNISNRMNQYLPSDISEADRAQHNVEGWREGSSRFKRMDDARKKLKDPSSYRPSHGVDQDRTNARYREIEDILNNCEK